MKQDLEAEKMKYETTFKSAQNFYVSLEFSPASFILVFKESTFQSSFHLLDENIIYCYQKEDNIT